MKDNKHPPIIVIGMHRSGTSMVSHMLEELGLFMGSKKDHNNEARFFFHINEWLFRQYAATWDNPHLFKQLLDNKEPMSSFLDYMRFLIRSPYVISFLGLSKYIRYQTLENLDMPWGWKDPRNTYTLPLWLEIFPNAKVIHIYRHGVDVAQSLKVRREKNVKSIFTGKSPKKLFHWYIWVRRRRQIWLTIRCASLAGGISLWEEYMSQSRDQVHKLEDRAIEVKYEDFLDKPYENLSLLSHFCELPATESDIKKVANQVNKARACAYLKNPELQRFADEASNRLREFGY